MPWHMKKMYQVSRKHQIIPLRFRSFCISNNFYWSRIIGSYTSLYWRSGISFTSVRNSVFSRVERSGTSEKTENFSHKWKKSQIFNRDECKNLFLPFLTKKITQIRIPRNIVDVFSTLTTWRHMKTSSLKRKDQTSFGFVYASILIKI